MFSSKVQSTSGIRGATVIRKLQIAGVFILIYLICPVYSQYSSPWRPSRLLERTAIDPVLMDSPFGVPVDYSYNETWEFYNWPWSLNSVPGCPRSIDGHPWVYYGSPKRCYLAGSRGPCEENSVILLEMFSAYGVCGCECLRYRFDYGEEEVVSEDGRYMYCSPRSGSRQVYDKARRMCFNLHGRGPCGPGEWLVRDPKGDSINCVPRCEPPYYFYDWWDARCRKSPPKGGSYSQNAAISNIPRNRCLYDEWYSPLLRRCLKTSRGPTPGLIIG